MLVAVRNVTARAEPRIVVEPGGIDLGEGQGRLERLCDPLRLVGVYGIAVPVVRGDALEDEVPALCVTSGVGRDASRGTSPRDLPGSDENHRDLNRRSDHLHSGFAVVTSMPARDTA